MFMKVMVAYVDMLGMWTESWKTCEFQCTRVVFKDLTIYVPLCIDNIKFVLPRFLDKFHERNDVIEGP